MQPLPAIDQAKTRNEQILSVGLPEHVDGMIQKYFKLHI